MRLFFIAIVLTTFITQGIAQPDKTDTGLQIGQKAPELRLPDPQDDTITLSSRKGYIVLIDFWASWCAPCIKEQPELKRLYKKYKQAKFADAKGFEIYGVSLDSKKKEWVNAINKLKTTWIQVSDLKFWNSEAARLYGLQEIPFNLLIDGNGTIIAVDLHGRELDKKISSLLKR